MRGPRMKKKGSASESAETYAVNYMAFQFRGKAKIGFSCGGTSQSCLVPVLGSQGAFVFYAPLAFPAP